MRGVLFWSKRPTFGGLFAELRTRPEQQIDAVSWIPLRATTDVRKSDDPL